MVAASLGQVHKIALRKIGQIVAVKTQRPGVLETVSLDLYLTREAGLLARIFPAFFNRLDTVTLSKNSHFDFPGIGL